MMRNFTMASMLLLSISVWTSVSHAKTVSLIGSWRGSGIIQPANGDKEKTRCRAQVLNAPGRGKYTAVYKCSSPLGLISQTVSVKKINSNQYSGTFHNALHNVRGVFSIILRGNKQSVVMQSSAGKGWINLSRQ